MKRSFRLLQVLSYRDFVTKTSADCYKSLKSHSTPQIVSTFSRFVVPERPLVMPPVMMISSPALSRK